MTPGGAVLRASTSSNRFKLCGTCTRSPFKVRIRHPPMAALGPTMPRRKAAGAGDFRSTTLAELLELRAWTIGHLDRAYDSVRAISVGVEVSTDCHRLLGADHPH